VDYHFSLFLPVGRGMCHIGDLEIPAGELLGHFFRICSESLEKRRRPGIHGQDAGDAAHLADLTSSGDFALRLNSLSDGGVVQVVPSSA